MTGDDGCSAFFRGDTDEQKDIADPRLTKDTFSRRIFFLPQKLKRSIYFEVAAADTSHIL